jgi:hypothetical protein
MELPEFYRGPSLVAFVGESNLKTLESDSKISYVLKLKRNRKGFSKKCIRSPAITRMINSTT